MSNILGTGKVAHDGFEHDANQSEGCEYCSARALTLTVISLENALAEAVALLRRAREHLDGRPWNTDAQKLVAAIDTYLSGGTPERKPRCACPPGWPQEGRANLTVWKHTGECPLHDVPIASGVWKDAVDAKPGASG